MFDSCYFSKETAFLPVMVNYWNNHWSSFTFCCSSQFGRSFKEEACLIQTQELTVAALVTRKSDSSLLFSSWVYLSNYLTCLHLSFLGENKEKSPTCKCKRFGTPNQVSVSLFQ